MDTKSLLDVLIEDDFNLKSYEPQEYEDAAAIWVDAVMKKPSWLMDFWLDALAEIHDTMRADELISVLERIGKVHEDVHCVQSQAKHSPGMALCMSTSLTQRSSFLGADIYQHILKFVTDYVNSNAAEWFADVLGYAADMEQSQKDDYLESIHDDR